MDYRGGDEGSARKLVALTTPDGTCLYFMNENKDPLLEWASSFLTSLVQMRILDVVSIEHSTGFHKLTPPGRQIACARLEAHLRNE